MTRLDYICYTNLTGYATAAKNYIKALCRRGGYDIKVTPLDFNFKRKGQTKEQEFFAPLYKKEDDPTGIHVFHCLPEMQRKFKPQGPTVGVAVYETIEPPAHWIALLNLNDVVITPSQFCHDTFVEAGLTTPISIIPHCLDMDAYHPSVEPRYKWDRFTFLYVGSWRNRKGYRELIEAWLLEFDESEPVQLMLKTDKPVIAKVAVEKVVKASGRKAAPIVIDNKRYPEEDMPGFFRSANCLISPTRGEGFGLPGLQSMAVGVPVIITNFSGCRDYANAETAYLLEPEGVRLEKTMDGIPQFTSKKWVYVSVDQIRQVMRYVYNHHSEALRRAKKARLCVESRFGYNNVANLMSVLIDNSL